jgi:hypothetical protein
LIGANTHIWLGRGLRCELLHQQPWPQLQLRRQEASMPPTHHEQQRRRNHALHNLGANPAVIASHACSKDRRRGFEWTLRLQLPGCRSHKAVSTQTGRWVGPFPALPCY